MKKSECSPFLSNYIRCDFLITFVALINILFEDKQVLRKEKLIARYLLSKEHSMFEKKFNDMKKFLGSYQNQEQTFSKQGKIPVSKKTKGGIKVSKQIASPKIDYDMVKLYDTILKDNEIK